ncbi:MAG: TIGR03905 family TSCPD domain-containing protein [Acholeplasmatales bacterium]|jgi:uncharacterized protein (TIGR03905 family)|nr:TIGR03905 family TSCPD domain-containing protein [Acholeplasmatales bacterium]
MRQTKVFYTKGVCSKKIEFDYEDGKMYNLVFEGGCPGNLKAIGKLCEGRDMLEIANLLKGNTCATKNTSCADQLANAIMEVLK